MDHNPEGGTYRLFPPHPHLLEQLKYVLLSRWVLTL